MKQVKGAIAVTVTPMLKGTVPNYKEVERQTELLCNSSIDGIFPCSSTGEYPKLTVEDKIKLMETVAIVNKGRKLLVAGACAVSIDEIKLYIDKAREFGYDACLSCPPYYYPLKQDEILAYYKEICAYAKDMNIIAYNVPFFTTGIELNTFAEMLKIPNLVGMKDSSGNMKKIDHECDVAYAVRKDFIMFTGTDDCLLPALIGGCKGSMTAFGADFPETIKAIYSNFESGNIAKAQEIQRSILPLLRLADSFVFPDGYKLVARATGIDVGDISILSNNEKVNEYYEKMKKEIKEKKL